jgi:hypothetical protein
MGDRKQSISKHNVGELNAKQVALDKVKALADASPKPSKEDKDRTTLRKRGSGGSPVPPTLIKGPGLVQGRSVLEQIGTPDFNGWLMKKGEHYNTWKSRYCVLKGHNLYWMRSNNAMVRASYLLPGCKLIFDSRRPRLKGISTLLAIGSLPTRMSNLEAMVSKWNTRTTRLICSILTPIPSSGNG